MDSPAIFHFCIAGNWSWTDGSNFGYTNWANGQPNPNNNTICLSSRYKVGKWYGESCFSPKPYVCKFPNNNSTTNSTITTTARPPGQCRKGWSLFSQANRCYILIHNVNFNQARSTCQNFSSNFISIHSAQENVFVQSLFMKNSLNYFCRIGLHNVNLSGNFTWVDGTKLDYTNWYQGKPDPSYPSAILTANSTATWYVSLDDQIYDAVCAYYL
uniref:C-type lectin domain-containing protein n=1 Tax=Acrobeloides nanus TaxID=290746 RepID=A0A914DT33_9BILA